MSLKQHSDKNVFSLLSINHIQETLRHAFMIYCQNLLEVQGKISCNNGNVNEVDDMLHLSSVEVLEDV